MRHDFDCPVWYRRNFLELTKPEKLCHDYWTIAHRYSTYREALEGRGMRWVLYTVYVVQRSRKTRWEAVESVIRDYVFPKKLYCSYMYLLWFSDRLARGSFEAAIAAVGGILSEVEVPVTEHWLVQFELELKQLEGP